MKKLLFLSLTLAGFASASTISEFCGSNTFAAPSGSFLTLPQTASYVCAPIGVAGTVTQIQLFYAADYSFGQASGPNSVTYTFNAATGTWSGGTTDMVNGLQSSNSALNVPLQSALLAGDGINTVVGAGQIDTTDLGVGTAGFTGVAVGTPSDVTITGGVSSTTGALFAQITYSTPTQGAPEPATLGLMGSALVGLGFLARRKK